MELIRLLKSLLKWHLINLINFQQIGKNMERMLDLCVIR